MIPEFLKGEVKWGPTSAGLFALGLLFVGVFIWQLVESGDPSEAGARTSAIFAAVSYGLFGLLRSWQAKK